MFDERFARQYRYEPPSEFPLTSPYTGIVHHLSGPKNNALTQTSSRRKKSVDAAGFLASFTFISRVGFSTTTLALVLDSLVRVSRRVGKNHFDKIAQGPSSRSTPSQTAHTRKRRQPASGIKRLHLAFQQSSTHPHAGFAENYFLILFYRFRLNDFKSFNFLSKVLFIFPSQYLFAIGFPHIFSLRRSLSPT